MSSFIFPLGVLPYDMVNSSMHYSGTSLLENITYFNNITSILFDNVYSKEEIDIINIFLACKCETSLDLDSTKKQIISKLLNINSDKTEIQYCLDEIRFSYLRMLIYTDSTDIELINSLLERLSTIEQEHNLINLDKKKI